MSKLFFAAAILAVIAAIALLATGSQEFRLPAAILLNLALLLGLVGAAFLGFRKIDQESKPVARA